MAGVDEIDSSLENSDFDADIVDTETEKNEFYETIRDTTDGISDRDVIMHIWKTPRNHTDRNTTEPAFLIGKIKVLEGQYTVILQSKPDMHVEKVLLKELSEKNETVRYITLYLKNSPCSECADELRNYLDINDEVQLVMYVANLHKVEELGMLKYSSQCRIEGFRKKKWEELFDLMKSCGELNARYDIPQATSRGEYDTNIRAALENI